MPNQNSKIFKLPLIIDGNTVIRAIALKEGWLKSNVISKNYIFDDVYDIDDNDFCGELLAIKEFNNKNTLRKITKATMLNQKRIFRRSPWTHQIYLTHIFDHKARSIEYIRERKSKVSILENPFI